MAKGRAPTNLLGLVDDSDDDLVPPSVAQDIKKSATTADMPRKRAAPSATKSTANKVTKPKAAATKARARRSSDRLAAAVEESDARGVLQDTTNSKAAAPAARRGRKPAAAQEIVDSDPASPAAEKPTRGKGRTAKAKGETATAAVVSAPTRRGRKPAAAKKAALEDEDAGDVTEIPETQPEAMLIDDEPAAEDEDVQMDALPPTRPTNLSPVRRSVSPTKFGASRRPASATDTETDATLRRRLGDLTKKYESLEAKYHRLRDIGVDEAERNFDRLKKQGEEKTNSSNDLIASLKADLAAQKDLSKEGSQFKKKWEVSETKLESLQTRIADLTTSLSDAKTEIKTLSTKLSAARQAEAAAAVKVPGSALKASRMGGADAVHASTHAAQRKEDLYGDLTGLIVRGVKRDSGKDVFDCIQTGRNGTLHFKLSVDHDDSGENYDEAQFMYMPQLDTGRDHALIDLLPDYLIEEITFPRPHAAKFYSRVMKSLTERVE